MRLDHYAAERIKQIKHRDDNNRSRCKRIEELKKVKEHFYKHLEETGEYNTEDLIEIVMNMLSLQECVLTPQGEATYEIKDMAR